MKNILVVGQTPPPFGGQAVMIDYLLKGEFTTVKLFHIRMGFSKNMKDLGKFNMRKFFHLISIILKIYYFRIFKGVSILYYPPSGPNSAVYRDMVILFPTRFLFNQTIFHFHASGLSTHLKNMNGFVKWVFKRSFFYPDLCIHLSKSCPEEGLSINSKKNCIVPNGVPDFAREFSTTDNYREFTILFVGLLEMSKGEFDVLKAVHLLKEKGINVNLKIAGQFKDLDYKKLFFDHIKKWELEQNVTYLGVIQGEEKSKVFSEADCFCFPSYFHSESFPLVLLEAMQFSLPIIGTKWRGIPDIIEDKENGFLIDIKSPDQIVEKIQILIDQPLLRKNMARKGRELFINKYEIGAHLQQMEQAFNTI